jgi:SAM-dependent methyltransferase
MLKNLLRPFIPSAILSYYNTVRAKRRIEQKRREYAGDSVQCPICESEYRAFAPFGKPQRSNAQCLTCGSLERHRLLYLFLRDRLGIFLPGQPSLALLHFAPEKVLFNKFSALPHVRYTACDYWPENYRYGKDAIAKVDITQIPYEENAFDLILCMHVLEHIPDDALAMSELYRVMKPGGHGIFQVPIKMHLEVTYEDPSITTPEGREQAFGQNDHVRLYGRDYKDRLSRAGFIVNADDFATTLSPDEILRFGVRRSEVIYHCQK